MILDDFPLDFRWELRTYPDDIVIWNNTNYTEGRTLIVKESCIPTNGCYRFVAYDSFGDGVCCFWGDGVVNGFLDGQRVFSFGRYGLSASSVFGECPSDAGTCESSGLGHNFTVAWTFDHRPQEINWTVYSGVENLGGRNYTDHILFERDGIALDTVCLPRDTSDACYRFVIVDDGHSGICCSQWANGTVSGFLDGEEIYQSDGRFGAGDTLFFSTDGESESDPCQQSCESRGEGNVTIVVELNINPSFMRFGFLQSRTNFRVWLGSQVVYVKDYITAPPPPMGTVVVDSFCLPVGHCYDGYVSIEFMGLCEVYWNGKRVLDCTISLDSGSRLDIPHQFGNCTTG